MNNEHLLKKMENTAGKQAGFSLIEISIVLVIMAGLIAAVVAFSTDTKMTAKSSEEVATLVASSDIISTHFDGDFTDISNDVVKQIISKNLLKKMTKGAASGTLVNQFGQVMTYDPATVNGVNNGGYTLTTSYPKETCVKTVKAADSTFEMISVGGDDVKVLDGELDKTALASSCDGGSNLIPIVFTGR